MIKIRYRDNTEVKFTQFPVGEWKIEIDEKTVHNEQPISIIWCYSDDSELFRVIALSEYLRERYKDRQIALEMPYIPYARMDRVKNEAFTLKTFAKLINSCNFDRVYVNDAHSNVSLALIDRVVNRVWTDDINLASKIDSETVVVYPDVTAEKRYSNELGGRALGSITCMKNRDFSTGKIVSLTPVTTLDPTYDWSKTRFVMVDDLCSYGGTFDLAINEIRKMFPTAFNFELVVGHLEKGYLSGKLMSNPHFTHLWTKRTLGWQYGLNDEEMLSLFGKKIHMFTA